MENKEDFVFVILLENKSQTVRRKNNDTVESRFKKDLGSDQNLS